jgi:hypothetical protein
MAGFSIFLMRHEVVDRFGNTHRKVINHLAYAYARGAYELARR